MSLATGTRLGPYEILSRIGSGGMGEVWKAHDTRLNRDVAIKTSAAKFSERFEREAQALAALNHPHICQIYEVGPDYIVMELVDGAPVEGPLPLHQALKLAIQLASAIEAAHRKTITHRDLKPANVLVAKSGIKVLDFGLAKFEQTKTVGPDDETLARSLTQEGAIVGTLQYMAPEQLNGRAVDSRADIFAFGCVLYEMLTGKRAFDGATTASVIGAILEREAPSVGDVAPASLDRLLKRCLAKDSDDRYQSARDLRADLEWVAAGGGQEIAPSRSLLGMGWAVAGVCALALAGLALLHFRETPAGGPLGPPVIRSTILPPTKTDFTTNSAPPALSPDGRLVVFRARSEDGSSQLYVRPLDTLAAQPLAGTDGASYPFWSPDSRSIGFAAGGKLKKIDAAGGPAVTLADAGAFLGGAWSQSGSEDGVIVFASSFSGPLRKIAAAGGSATDATSLDVSPGLNSHRWPWFLPDGRHFLYLAAPAGGSTEGDIRIGSLDVGGPGVPPGGAMGRTLGKANSQAVYSEGHLLFLRGETLMAQPFDTKRLEVTGEAVPVAEHIAPFSVSASGVLAYQTSAAANKSLVWFDRGGKRTGTVDDPGNLFRLRLSPDRKLAALSVLTAGNTDIWIYDFSRGLRSRFTFDPAAENDMVWSPDGKTIVFDSNRRGHFDLYRKAVNGTGTEELLYADGTGKYPTSWSRDGKYLLYFGVGSAGRPAIFALSLAADAKPIPFVRTDFSEVNAQFSPDGRWVAYQGNESGRFEVYVAPFPGPGGKRQVSVAGGILPRWRADGKELFFITPDRKLMAAEIGLKPNDVEVGAVLPLFAGVPAGTGYLYDISADGQRFLVVVPAGQTGPSEPLTLVQNWMAGLRK